MSNKIKGKSGEMLTRKQVDFIKFYHERPKYMSDDYVAEFSGFPRNSIRQFRIRLAKKGYSFSYITVDDGTASVYNEYKYLGKAHVGIKCVDERLDPVMDSDMKKYRYRVRSKNTSLVMEWLLEHNSRGYWKQDEMAKQLGITNKECQTAIQSLKINLGFKVHGRNDIKDREYIVTEITGQRTRYNPKDTKTTKDHLTSINKVFC